MAPSKSPSVWKPLHVEVVWDDPKSTHDCYTVADVLRGNGAGLQRNRKTVGYLGYINDEYLELYSDFDEADQELGGGTAILLVLIKKIKVANGRTLYSRG